MLLKKCFSLLLVYSIVLTIYGKDIFKSQLDRKINVMGPYHFAVGDLNNDGKVDIAVSCWYKLPGKGYKYDRDKHGVYVYYQNNGGSFSNKADKILKVKQPRSVVIADLNNDKLNDVAVVERNKGLHIYYQNEKFEKEHSYPQLGGVSTNALKAADMNENGLNDLVMDGVWRQNKGKNFALGYFYTTAKPVLIDSISPCIADLNGDGANDVIFGSFIPEKKTVRIYYGPFTGTKVYPDDIEYRLLELPVVFGKDFGRIAAGDFNSDGRPDIAVSPSGSKDTYIYFQNSPADFSNGAKPGLILKDINGLIEAVDLNGDKLKDLVIAERGWKNNKIIILLQKKDGFQSVNKNGPTCTLTTKSHFSNSALQVSDLNGDGRPDILITSDHGSRPGLVKIFLNKNSTGKSTK